MNRSFIVFVTVGFLMTASGVLTTASAGIIDLVAEVAVRLISSYAKSEPAQASIPTPISTSTSTVQPTGEADVCCLKLGESCEAVAATYEWEPTSTCDKSGKVVCVNSFCGK